MTENMAGRGEGLAGLREALEKIKRESARDQFMNDPADLLLGIHDIAEAALALGTRAAAMEHDTGDEGPVAATLEHGGIEWYRPVEEGTFLFVKCWMQGQIEHGRRKCAEAIAALEAAAPAGTAGICPICYHPSAALATPSPQAPEPMCECTRGLDGTLVTMNCERHKRLIAPAATQEPAGSALLCPRCGCASKDNPFDQRRRLCLTCCSGFDIADADPSSPRKVGEDGPRSQEWLNGYAQGCSDMTPRPSSVPVGEQKQEEGA